LLELAKSKAVITLGKKPVRIKNTNIYGANWKDSIPIPTNTSVKNILVLHASISKKAEWDGHDFTHPRYFLKKHNRFDLILVGDIHKEFCINQNNKWIINTGPMLRLEANKYNFSHKPCFYIWDSRTLKTKRIQIPHEPAEIVLTRDHIEEKKLNQEELDAFASSLKNMRSITNIREKKIKEYLRSKIKDQKVSEIVLKIMENTNEHRKQN
jgi:DNA repair exonuclease SbcCD nuclease subunit